MDSDASACVYEAVMNRRPTLRVCYQVERRVLACWVLPHNIENDAAVDAMTVAGLLAEERRRVIL